MKCILVFLASLSAREVKAVRDLKYNNFKRKLQTLHNVTSPSPSLSPSVIHSSIPTLQQSINPSIRPSLSPSTTPSNLASSKPSTSLSPTSDLTSRPSFQHSSAPSLSPIPSSNPSCVPSSSPSHAIATTTVFDLEMILEGMDEEMESSDAQDIWRQITSNQVQLFWQSSENKSFGSTDGQIIKYEDDLIDEISTFITRQDIITLRDASKSNDVALRIRYFHEVSHRLGSDIILPSKFSIKPFETETNKKKYIDELKLINAVFQPISDLTVRIMILDPPKPKDQITNVIIVWTSVLSCLIALMAMSSVWFFFIYNRDDSSNNRRCIHICPWTRKNDEGNHVLPHTNQNESGRSPFAIHFTSGEIGREDDTSLVFIQEEVSRKNTHEDNHMNMLSIVSEGSSQDSKLSGPQRESGEEEEEEEEMETLLREPLFEDGSDVHQNNSTSVGPTKKMSGTGDFSNVHMLQVSDIDDIDFNV